MQVSAANAYVNGEYLTNVSIDITAKKVIGAALQPEFEFVIPEFVDIHCHGGGGNYFWENAEVAANVHRENGTGIQIASLVTLGIEHTRQAVANLAKSDDIWGIHLEGPYLSHSFSGAHEKGLLRQPSIDEMRVLIDIGVGKIKMVTIAPELEGAIGLIKFLVEKKIIVALGHSAANADTTRAAIAAGATVITHFNNAMSKLGSTDSLSEIGLASDLALEIIPDLQHIPEETLKGIVKAAPSRCIAITDAMSAAGNPDGAYKIGALDVTVKDGVAKLASNGKLAGSTLTMRHAFTNLNRIFGTKIAVELTSQHARRLFGITREENYLGIRGDTVMGLQHALS